MTTTEARHTRAKIEIARRLALTEAATPGGPWTATREIGEDLHFGQMEFTRLDAEPEPGGQHPRNLFAVHGLSLATAMFMAANDPTHVGAVLRMTDGLLDLHAPEMYGGVGWVCESCIGSDEEPREFPCPTVEPLLDVYAPNPAEPE